MAVMSGWIRGTLIQINAVFDFHAGAENRSRVRIKQCGLELLHRLASEPRRLSRWYVLLTPRFVWLVAMRNLKN